VHHRSPSQSALEAAAELARTARLDKLAAGYGESFNRAEGAELLRAARDAMQRQQLQHGGVGGDEQLRELRGSFEGGDVGLSLDGDGGHGSPRRYGGWGGAIPSLRGLFEPISENELVVPDGSASLSAASSAKSSTGAVEASEAISGASSASVSPSLSFKEGSKKASTGGDEPKEKKKKDKDKKKDKKDKRDQEKLKEVKVKSKDGLKSFLVLTERILEKLLALRCEASAEAAAAVRLAGEHNSGYAAAALEPALVETLAYLEGLVLRLQQIKDVLGRGEISGMTRKLQIKVLAWAPEDAAAAAAAAAAQGSEPFVRRAARLQIILKWGGALTPLGEAQAQLLGENLRKSLYPDAPGGGVLRLHATFRHDLKIRTSDEGRVMKTAASFAKGMLQLEGALVPILVSLVRKEKGSLHMLDHAGNEAVNADLQRCKRSLNKSLQEDADLNAGDISALTPTGQASVMRALERIKNPRAKLVLIHRAIGALVGHLKPIAAAVLAGEVEAPRLYMDETVLLMFDRWRKLHDDFFTPLDLAQTPASPLGGGPDVSGAMEDLPR